MRTPRDVFALATVLLAVASIGSLVYLGVGSGKTNSSVLATLVSGVFGALVATYFAYVARTLNKNPTPVKVALVGRPGSGKTVFLTMLFDQIQVEGSQGISFAPYGRETIEQVTGTLSDLSHGRWPARTLTNTVAFYRASATVGANIIQKRYTVELADYAGEHIDEFDSSAPAWLHRTSYFRYVVGCDALILAVDSAVLRTHNRVATEEIQNDLVAAFQIIVDEKGITSERRLREPVALTFMKSDLIATAAEQERAIASMERLVSICEKRCRHFAVFFVSSVGNVGMDNSPPSRLRPVNVIAPMAWIMRRIVV